jgi:FlaA1/EpsC-like NDP-sugar epimerase
MRPLVRRCYIQWLCNVCVACGMYVVIWKYFIISQQMVIVLYIEVIQSTLICYCKRRKCILLSIYTLMTSLLMP